MQANYGARELLRIDGVRVGEAIPRAEVPSPWDEADALAAREGAEGGSIIVIVATDAPLLPHQCARLAQRAGMGVARMGSYASHGSGDLFCAFATGNRDLSRNAGEDDPRPTVGLRMVVDEHINPLLEAAAEATEAAIVNALLAAETMTGPRRDHRSCARPRSAHGDPARARPRVGVAAGTSDDVAADGANVHSPPHR